MGCDNGPRGERDEFSQFASSFLHIFGIRLFVFLLLLSISPSLSQALFFSSPLLSASSPWLSVFAPPQKDPLSLPPKRYHLPQTNPHQETWLKKKKKKKANQQQGIPFRERKRELPSRPPPDVKHSNTKKQNTSEIFIVKDS